MSKKSLSTLRQEPTMSKKKQTGHKGTCLYLRSFSKVAGIGPTAAIERGHFISLNLS